MTGTSLVFTETLSGSSIGVGEGHKKTEDKAIQSWVIMEAATPSLGSFSESI
jgi:hypothetical protein